MVDCSGVIDVQVFVLFFGLFCLLQSRKKTFNTLIPKARVQIFNIYQSAHFKLSLPKFQDRG